MKPIYITFTGACYSGKTTSIRIAKSILESEGFNVYEFSELIRECNIASIDDVRNDPDKYMEVQDSIIRGKIQMEKDFKHKMFEKKTVMLIDRAVTDSLFYLTFYTHKNGLDKAHQEMFFSLFDFLNNYLDNCTDIYDYVFEFAPLENKTEKDDFRPQNISKMQIIEYEMIKKYNDLYFAKIGERYKKIDLNNVNIDEMEIFWKKYFKENGII